MDLPAWNRALLERLLPDGADGQPVLLACDDDAVTDAAGGAPDAVADLVTAAKTGYGIDAPRGVRGAVHAGREFARGTRPRPGPPPQLAALSLATLAASRMDRDEQISTRAYYDRLLAVLDLPAQPGWPPVRAFDDLVEQFADLAEWLAADQAARRGVLVLPAVQPARRVVGVPISQTLLRGRDRALMSAFFVERRGALDAGHDPLRMLRTWPGRTRLTLYAQTQLGDDELAEALRGAISAAYAAWDGSTVDERGHRTLPSRLRLGFGLGKVTLNLTVPGLDAVISAAGPGGAVRLSPGAETVLDLGLLPQAADGPVTLTLPDATRVRALPGNTMIFEVTDAGMELTASPAETDRVWVLTCDPRLTTRSWPEDQLITGGLSGGWALLAEINPVDLPDCGTPAAPADSEGAWLHGGLELGGGAWLTGHPPHVSADFDEPVTLVLYGRDGRERQLGYLEVGRGRALREAAATDTWKLIVADSLELTFEMAERGRRTDTGALRHAPAHRALVTAAGVRWPGANGLWRGRRRRRDAVDHPADRARQRARARRLQRRAL
ncbi:MAG: hypothetical protein M3P44_07765 [Actinomycetota bacterium]|nr:hypothetical protein [Actinomycetota bacterium]